MRLVRSIVIGSGALLILLITSPLLFWLGRSSPRRTGELVVDPELDSNDPGTDVDDHR